ncbi:MAG: phosphate ABC transporter permease PstA [Myxococcales bacterium]|nr:phosphate ABC transporter permease PstA [Myxococcales bacterium]MBK7190933.1 phosphate ABC transporter permease PstA [Myxococcales bacterium]MBP6847496.1 phosphate ABC transporter permease PstA [Kofleriaceae bacterium]
MRRPIDLTSARPGVFAEKAFVWLCRLGAAIPLTMLAWLLYRVAAAGVHRLSWSFLTDPPSQLDASAAGLGPALMGTLWLIVLTATIALPIGIGAAIYLEEYSRRSKLAGLLELAIANLAGVPSIVYGMLGLGLFVHALAMGETVIAGALTLALLILPIIITSAREALRTVKDSLREAALGLGATRWQCTRQVVLPMALPGILTGAILAIARAIGETAPLVVVGAVAFILYGPDGVDAKYTALPMQIFQWTSNPKRAFLDNAAAGILVLMTTLLVINGVAIWLRNRYQSRRS